MATQEHAVPAAVQIPVDVEDAAVGATAATVAPRRRVVGVVIPVRPVLAIPLDIDRPLAVESPLTVESALAVDGLLALPGLLLAHGLLLAQSLGLPPLQGLLLLDPLLLELVLPLQSLLALDPVLPLLVLDLALLLLLALDPVLADRLLAAHGLLLTPVLNPLLLLLLLLLVDAAVLVPLLLLLLLLLLALLVVFIGLGMRRASVPPLARECRIHRQGQGCGEEQDRPENLGERFLGIHGVTSC
jgi:hypothetical protein